MRYLLLVIFMISLLSCSEDKADIAKETKELEITYIFIGEKALTTSGLNESVPTEGPIRIRFVGAVDRLSFENNISLLKNNTPIQLEFSFLDNDKLVEIIIPPLSENTGYALKLGSELIGQNDEFFAGIEIAFTTLTSPLLLESVLIDDDEVDLLNKIKNVGLIPKFQVQFNKNVTKQQLSKHSTISKNGTSVNHTITQLNETTLAFEVKEELLDYSKYNLSISEDLSNEVLRPFDGLDMEFYTKLDSTLKFPEISDEELLTKVQQQTFRYFWDFAHPVSGLIRERNTSGELVTIGGSGFGVMTILVGIERGFITRQEGVDRLEKIITFLDAKAERFHGVWSHWLNGTSGEVIPFSTDDDGGDLVESSFMVQGLLTVRQYLNSSNQQESSIINTINKLWEEVEWDWYTQDDQDVLYWHWSENFGWQKNHKITGWNEALIVYALAASSPTHSIDREVYTEGWSRSGTMVNTNNNSYYGHTLDLRNDMGGPLFFAHYSFLGLDPRKLSDQYANYWEQNVNHSAINHAYCMDNPKDYIGYSEQSWGLTASDSHGGYSAHSPNNDLGVITPTAAISSIPYMPKESMDAIRHFYYILGDDLWGEYGFYDAFNVTEGWTASSYLAIDQGPIIVMIENHRTGLLWDLFMSAPEVKSGLTKLEISYE